MSRQTRASSSEHEGRGRTENRVVVSAAIVVDQGFQKCVPLKGSGGKSQGFRQTYVNIQKIILYYTREIKVHQNNSD